MKTELNINVDRPKIILEREKERNQNIVGLCCLYVFSY